LSKYEVVIPYYDDYDNLCLLLQDIARCNQRFKPERILIVNDGSLDNRILEIPVKYNIDLLPTIELETIDHSGFKVALEHGLRSVKTKFATVVHSDTRLISNKTKVDLFKDVFSVLFFHIRDVEDAMTVSCFSLDSYNDSINKDYIVGGLRHMGSEGMIIHHHMFRASGLIPIMWTKWYRCFSVSDNIFAINVDLYKEVGGFDDNLSKHGLFLDDFLATSRVKGYHTYFTHETVAYHSRKKVLPENSFCEMDSNDNEYFLDKWKDHSVWTEIALFRGVLIGDQIE